MLNLPFTGCLFEVEDNRTVIEEPSIFDFNREIPATTWFHYSGAVNALDQNAVNQAIDYLGIKVSNYDNLITSLSGGNQQKVVIAKALETDPKLLMLDEPTRGVDVGAKQEIFYIMKKLADKGLSIIFVSSEIKEVLAVADRVLVLAKGKITKELIGSELTEDSLVKYSQG